MRVGVDRETNLCLDLKVRSSLSVFCRFCEPFFGEEHLERESGSFLIVGREGNANKAGETFPLFFPPVASVRKLRRLTLDLLEEN